MLEPVSQPTGAPLSAPALCPHPASSSSSVRSRPQTPRHQAPPRARTPSRTSSAAATRNSRSSASSMPSAGAKTWDCWGELSARSSDSSRLGGSRKRSAELCGASRPPGCGGRCGREGLARPAAAAVAPAAAAAAPAAAAASSTGGAAAKGLCASRASACSAPSPCASGETEDSAAGAAAAAVGAAAGPVDCWDSTGPALPSRCAGPARGSMRGMHVVHVMDHQVPVGRPDGEAVFRDRIHAHSRLAPLKSAQAAHLPQRCYAWPAGARPPLPRLRLRRLPPPQQQHAPPPAACRENPCARAAASFATSTAGWPLRRRNHSAQSGAAPWRACTCSTAQRDGPS